MSKSWIKFISMNEAEGKLKAVYEALVPECEKEDLANVLRVSSVHPEVIDGHLALYRPLLFGKGLLSRTQREMIATVVSKTNGCHY